MTEAEWLTCTDPTPMLEFLRGTGRVSERKLRLFAVAACRRIWHLMMDQRTRKAIGTAEVYADGEASSVALERACCQADSPPPTERAAFCAASAAASAADVADYEHDMVAHAENAVEDASWATYLAAQAAYSGEAARDVRTAANYEDGWDAGQAARDAERNAQAALLRDVMGLLAFRALVSPDAAWLTPSVVALAQAAYGHRVSPADRLDPNRLAELAAALDAAACKEGELIGHLRGPGTHVRGCWALDLVLGQA